MMQTSEIFSTKAEVYLPFFLHQYKVQAGFPSPADDYIEAKLDLNKYLVTNPVSTFFVRVSGYSMKHNGINDKDLLIVDRSLEPCHNKIVVAVVRGEFTVKKLKINKEGNSYLIDESNSNSFIKLDEDSYVWGVVKSVIHEF